MERHEFDILSAFFGVIFTGAALIVMLTDEVVLAVDSQWVWPAVILLAGIALIASGIRRHRETDQPLETGAAGDLPPEYPHAD